MDSKELFQKAYDMHYRKKQYEEAINIYHEVVNKYPNSSEAQYAEQQIKNLNEQMEIRQISEEALREQKAFVDKLNNLPIYTVEFAPGYRITGSCGLVYGNSVRATHIGRDFTASIQSVVGGELTSYAKLMEESYEEALKRIRKAAVEKGCNAIVGFKVSTSEIAGGASEIIVYGTGVILKAE